GVIAEGASDASKIAKAGNLANYSHEGLYYKAMNSAQRGIADEGLADLFKLGEVATQQGAVRVPTGTAKIRDIVDEQTSKVINQIEGGANAGRVVGAEQMPYTVSRAVGQGVRDYVFKDFD